MAGSRMSAISASLWSSFDPMPSPRVVGHPRLSDERHLHLARIRQLVLDALRDLARHPLSRPVADLRGVHHHPDLAPGLDRVRVIDALIPAGDLLQLLQTL